MWRNREMHSAVRARYICRRSPVFTWRGQRLKNVKVGAQLMSVFCHRDIVVAERIRDAPIIGIG